MHCCCLHVVSTFCNLRPPCQLVGYSFGAFGLHIFENFGEQCPIECDTTSESHCGMPGRPYFLQWCNSSSTKSSPGCARVFSGDYIGGILLGVWWAAETSFPRQISRDISNASPRTCRRRLTRESFRPRKNEVPWNFSWCLNIVGYFWKYKKTHSKWFL